MKHKISCAILSALMTVSLLAMSGCGSSPISVTTPGGTSPVSTAEPKSGDDTGLGSDFTVTKAASRQVTYETYDNGLIVLDIPRGWQVVVPSGVAYSGYSFKMYDPENPDYCMLFCLKFSGFLKSEAARESFNRLYPTANVAFGKVPAIDPQTTEAFFKVWDGGAEYVNEIIGYDYLPYLKGFSVIENLGTVIYGGDILRASFTSATGAAMQGIFTGSVVDSGGYYMYGKDFAPLSVYHNILMLAPDDDFMNWISVYDHCIGTLKFTEKFMKGFNDEENAMMASVMANQAVYESTSAMIMDSWEQRSSSYDIISQKRSDATLGYERVYDTETGDVYRAYNGFTDDYQGQRYKAITDDMYTSTITGYINK